MSPPCFSILVSYSDYVMTHSDIIGKTTPIHPQASQPSAVNSTLPIKSLQSHRTIAQIASILGLHTTYLSSHAVADVLGPLLDSLYNSTLKYINDSILSQRQIHKNRLKCPQQ